MSNEQQTPAPAAKNKKEKGASNLLSLISLILILLIIILVSVAGWFGWQKYQSHDQQLTLLQSQLDGAMGGLEASQTRENMLIKRAQNLTAIAETLQEQVTFNSAQLAKVPGAERQDWLLAEAEYLLRLANQRLQLERDWDGAVSMLIAADNVLIETRNPRFNSVRAQIAKELMALRAVPAIDRVGAVYRIQALQESITLLPWMPDKLIIPAVADSDIEPETLDEQVWYRHYWNLAKDNVVRMVRIQQRDKPLAAPLNPDQKYYLQQNMNLMLEQAQVALVREQTELYQHSLKRVADWLNDYLMMEDERTLAARNALAELQAWDADPERPDISASLTLLQKLVEQQRRGTVQSAKAATPAASKTNAPAPAKEAKPAAAKPAAAENTTTPAADATTKAEEGK
ncbi:MAG: uroporphyrinogen-III C-methyltransferase [Oleibacter sp.]|nr:uroporphyrinogen-III C-methyltransferase [Thalassolituus sp.]